MNEKKAKALRKKIGFHPQKDERKYNAAVTHDLSGRLRTVPTTRVNHETSSRAKYQAAKREQK